MSVPITRVLGTGLNPSWAGEADVVDSEQLLLAWEPLNQDI